MDIKLYLLLTTGLYAVFVTAWDGDTTPDTGFSDEWEPVSCATTDCPENKVCNDDLGFVSCVCKEGMAGFSCDLVDPCVRNTTNCPDGMTCFADCPPNVICEGFSGIAQCDGCVKGWTGTNCLDDVDECEQEDGHSCMKGGVCVNTVGSYRCSCQPEWTGSDCGCERGSECDPQSSGTVMLMSSTLINSFFVLVVSLSLSLSDFIC